jgi:hypothetical protein
MEFAGGFEASYDSPAPIAGETKKGEPPAAPPVANNQNHQGTKLMDGERVVFTEEGGPSQYLKLIASGDVDAVLLEALEDFVKRQKKRLGMKERSAEEFAQTQAPGSVTQPLGRPFR